MSIHFTDINEQHLGALAAILNYYVENSTVTFHKMPLQPDEMKDKVFFDKPFYRSFLITDDNSVLGYCAVSPWKKQEAYRHTAEVNIYLAHQFTGSGLGSLALVHLEEFAKANGIQVLIAGLCIENEPSKKLFEKNGYVQCAHFKEVGSKFGRLLDVIYLQKLLD